jgi:glycolate oxidase FAD binding subunit
MKGQAMRPVSEAELCDIVRAAGPLAIRGGGTRGIGRAKGLVLETSGLTGISLYEPGALTLVAQAGTALAEIETVLAGERQRLAFEVPDMRGLLRRDGVSTIGGVVAANASGPRRVQVGACRDALLGVRFVDGRGAVIKNGGRVMKNVTGYDLVKLMAGAQGALGVLTEVSFKVQAVPEVEATLISDLEEIAGLSALRAALRSPFDVSGAAYANGRAMIRLEGLAGSVAYRRRALAAVLGGGWDVVEGAASAGLWRQVRDVTAFADVQGAVWKLSVKPSDAAEIVAGLAALDVRAIHDWGGGLVWLLVPQDDAGAVRAAVAAKGGHATLARGLPGMTEPVFPPEPAAVAALTAGLRAQFDPRAILNTGIMG